VSCCVSMFATSQQLREFVVVVVVVVDDAMHSVHMSTITLVLHIVLSSYHPLELSTSLVNLSLVFH
jgi:hypothetical protein